MLTADPRSWPVGVLRARLVATTERPGWRWLLGLAGLALVLATLALALVWSYRTAPPFVLDLGSRDADPFITGFHAPERTPDGALTYRWSRGSAGILAPGFGRRDAVLTLDLAGAGRGDAPLPAVTVLAGGQEVAQLQTTAAVQRSTIPIPASLMAGGDVRVELRTTEFRPPNDARRLGVLVDAARVEAARDAPALPPWRLALLAAAAVVAVALVAALVVGKPGPALALATVTAAALVVASRLDRFTWALWLPDAVPLVVVSGVALGAGCWVLGIGDRGWTWAERSRSQGSRDLLPLPRAGAGIDSGDQEGPVPSPTGVGEGEGEGPSVSLPPVPRPPIPDPRPLVPRSLLLILWGVALANLLGVAHPQFRSSDLTMNVHRLEEVARGSWLFTLALPGPSALPAPYPPAFYALLLPVLPLVDHDFGLKQALVTHASAALLTALAAIAYVVGARIGGRAAGLWAAALQGFAPAGFLLVSQGNFANIFGQAAAGLVLLLLALLPDWRRPLPALAIVAALLVALLGHFGIFLSLLLAVPAMVVFVTTLPPPGRRQALTLAGLFSAALLLAVAIYYRHYIGLVAEVAQRVAAARASGDSAALGWSAGLGLEWRRTVEALGWLALPLAAGALVGLWRGAQAGRLTLGWLAAAAIFALVGLGLGLSVRYQFFALLGLAIAGGLSLAWLARRGWPGRALAVALTAVWVGGGLLFWYTRILTYLH